MTIMSGEEERILNQNHQVVDEERQGMISNWRKGGWKTIPFILGNEVFERVASLGLTPNMLVYLMDEYKMSLKDAQNLIYSWNTAANFTPFVGAFLADTLLGRFALIGIGSIFSLAGMLVFWLTTVIPQARPSPCDVLSFNCQSSTTTGQYAFLIFAFVLLAIGGGGTRPCSQVFGSDQVDRGDDPTKNNKKVELFISWYNMFSCVSMIIAMTAIVYIQDHLGWMIGFGVPLALMFLASLLFFLASPLYVMVKGNKNLFSGLAQIIVAAFRNRRMNLPQQGHDANYYQGTDPVTVATDKLRFLNKACIIQDPAEDIGPDGMPRDPWRLCRLKDVEGLKTFIRILPIWSAGIMMSVNTSASPFALLLTRTMDRHVGRHFEIPAASFGIFIIVVMGVWIPLYHRVILPVASKIRGKEVTLSVKMRLGLGLFFSFMSILSSGIVESIRRQKAIAQGFEDDPVAEINMSALWMIPHSIFGGIAEAFFVIAWQEFFYTELPKKMLSIAGAIFGLATTVGSLAASLLLNLVDAVTKSEGGEGWISSNVNKGHYDYYYYVLAALNLLNILYYVCCSRAYGPTKSERVVQPVLDEDADARSPLLRNNAAGSGNQANGIEEKW